jgi:tetratricopeptide (TPR) repeat protein
MDEETRAHNESLLQIYTGHLRQLELMAAKYGDLAVPSHVALEIAEYRRKITDLEGRLRPIATQQKALPHHNLPRRDYDRLIGRQQEQAEVRRLLGPHNRAFVISIEGIGGIGKSSLALESAYAFVEQYAQLLEEDRFDAIVWVSAKRTYLAPDGIRERQQVFRTLEDVFTAIARVLDYPAIIRARADEQRAIVEQALREQRTLLILDNMETVDDDELMDFLHELPEPTKALVTTRYRIPVARPIRLTGVEQSDALLLIAEEARRRNITLSQAEEMQLWNSTGGVPLAIVWSIGLMDMGGSVESVLHRLNSSESDIARFCFEESVAQVRGKHAHKLLLALALFISPASRNSLGHIAGLDTNPYGRDLGLADLVRLSLVNQATDRFSLLPLTRSFALAEAAIDPEWTAAARERLFDHIFNLVNAGSQTKLDWEATDLLERKLPDALAVFDQRSAELRYLSSDENERQIVPEQAAFALKLLRLNRALVWVCRIRGYWADCERLCHTGIVISQSLNELANIGSRYRDLSKITYLRGDLASARSWAEQSRACFERAGMNKSICYMDRQLGLIALREGDFDRAAKLLEHAKDEYVRLGGQGSLASYLGSLGELAVARGDLQTAEAYFGAAIEHLRQRNNIHNLAMDLLNLSGVKLAQGDIDSAAAHLDESQRLAQECGRVDVIARGRQGMALLELVRGNHAMATAFTREALDQFHRLGMKREHAEAEALLTKLTGPSQNS